MTSKKPKSQNFKYTPTSVLPALKTIKTEWDLKTHYYKSENDPQIEKDILAYELGVSSFVKKYAKKDFTSSAAKLFPALVDALKLSELVGYKPAYYYSYRLALNSADTVAQKKLNQMEARLTKTGNTLVFFELAIGKIPTKLQKEILKDAKFALYHHYLAGIFETAKYNLSEPEEKILNLKSQTSSSMWVSGTEKILGATSIKYKGKDVPLNGALMQFMDLPPKERHIMWVACADALKKLGPIAENELNAVITDKKINDELRGFKKPYSATVLGHDMTENSLEALVAAISNRGYKLTRKFFAHKAKLAGKKLSFIDRDDFGEALPKIDFDTATTICRDSFYDFNPIYGQIFDEMLERGNIDVYPKQGKGGGAFCSSGTNMPTLVLLNHSSDFQAVSTFAHEMGHAVHAYRSKLQPLLYQDHSTVTAETASTFFESVVSHRLLAQLEGQQRTAMLNTQICDKINTIVMCIARYKAELEIHETIRREGAMTWQEMAACLVRHFTDYCGSAIDFNETDGYNVIAKIHYRMYFYQYSYSFGNLASSIMFKRYMDNHDYATKVDTFLTAGDHASVEKIFKSIGIDVSKSAAFDEGLDLLEADIEAFIKATK